MVVPQKPTQVDPDPQGEDALRQGSAAYVSKDYAGAIRSFRRAADKGNAEAMEWIGNLFADGAGVTTDYGEAMRWYRQAADKGFARAMSNIGALYTYGHGVPRDCDTAHRWFVQAAGLGYSDAKDWLAQRGLGCHWP